MHTIKPVSAIRKEIPIPSDKSISHRALIISALSQEATTIMPLLESNDTHATLGCIKKLGISVTRLKAGALRIKGRGLYLPQKRALTLDAHESGTTMRVLTGVLCAQRYRSRFTCAVSLKKRPMGRVVYPLRNMGAKIEGIVQGKHEIYPPLVIHPTKGIQGCNHSLPIASAQVKSALMLAALYADKKTTIHQPFQSRDHTERMLRAFGVPLRVKKNMIIAFPARRLKSPGALFIPSDFSSAAFFIVLGLLLKESELSMRHVSINPTRSGLLTVLRRMGASIRISNKKNYYEPYADITVKSSKLCATKVKADEVPLLIDEVPILCVAACFAKGTTVIDGVQELHVKETDRVRSIVYNLKKAGAAISFKKTQHTSSILIRGVRRFKPGAFKSFNDHRTAMSMIVFSLAQKEESSIDNVSCIGKSFPEFLGIIKSL